MLNLQILTCILCACFCLPVYADDVTSDQDALATSKEKYSLSQGCRFFPPKGSL